MYNGINISEGTLISSCDDGEEMIIPRVRHMYNSWCENLDLCNGSLIMKSGRGKESVRHVAEFYT
jgi:hypothetical protein